MITTGGAIPLLTKQKQMKNSKLKLTEFDKKNLIYAINLNLDYLDGIEGVKREVKSLEKTLESLGGKREYC